MGNERLSEEKINELIEFHRTIKDKKDADKIKCVIYWGKNWTWKQIEEALFISNPTISRIVNEYKNLGMKGLIGTKYTGHNYKLTSEQEKTLCKYLSSHFISSFASIAGKMAFLFLASIYPALFVMVENLDDDVFRMSLFEILLTVLEKRSCRVLFQIGCIPQPINFSLVKRIINIIT